MTTAIDTWQDLFRQQRHALLGQQARAYRNSSVNSLADDETLLVGGAGNGAARSSDRPSAKVAKPPKAIALAPESKEQTLEAFRALADQTRLDHPQAQLDGFGPLGAPLEERFRGLDRGVILVGRVASSFEPAVQQGDLEEINLPLTAVLLYTPEVTPEAIEQASHLISNLPGLVSVLPLPAGAGDRIPLAGLTTSGTVDVMVISALRILLPGKVRVRASWAALGWKVAQVTLAYGADELAGWTAAETLAYTGRVRAAARVERREVDEGLAEARCSDAGWSTHIGGAS